MRVSQFRGSLRRSTTRDTKPTSSLQLTKRKLGGLPSVKKAAPIPLLLWC